MYQFRSARKKTGGRYRRISKKKKRFIGSDFIPIKLAKTKAKLIRTTGAGTKVRLLAADRVNVLDPASQTVKPLVKILAVKENPANPHFVRMSIITKGAVVETELGLVKIMSRPGQHGVLNGVLIGAKK